MLLPGADLEPATRRAESIRVAVERHTFKLTPTATCHVTVSIGAARYHGDLADALRRADTALYLSKEHGRNRVTADISPLEAVLSDPRHEAAIR